MAVMTRDEAMAFLADGTRTGKLATASPSGDPHVAPIWFIVDGDDLVFTTGENTMKGRHLFATGRAALAVDESVFPYSFVLVRGPVSLDENPPDMPVWATRIADRYVPAGRGPEYGARNGVPGELLCRLRIEHLTGGRDIAL
jgi:PPOX class probable F420-dependent enzyme